MLPFSKRPAHIDEVEDLGTGDIYEVIKAPKGLAALRTPSPFPSPPASRPRVFDRLIADEVTTLMPAKDAQNLPPVPAPPRSSRTSNRTPTPARSVATKYQGGYVSRPATETNYRPMSATPVTMIPTPVHSLAPMAMSANDSDPRIDFPGTVITTRTKIMSRPTMSWAAALVAMGVFAGLVTAVLARGDGDALVDATAAFVDPAHATHASAAAAAVQAPMLSPLVGSMSAPVVTGVVMPIAEVPILAPRRAPTPIAYAAPPKKEAIEARTVEAPKVAKAAPPPAPKPAAAPAAPKVEKTVVASAPPPAKPSRKSVSRDDVDAEAANALAKAQLEQAMR